MRVDDRGDDVAAEIVAAVAAGGVAAELLEQEPGREDVDPHRGQAVLRVAGDRLRLGRLLLETRPRDSRCRPPSRRTLRASSQVTRKHADRQVGLVGSMWKSTSFW